MTVVKCAVDKHLLSCRPLSEKWKRKKKMMMMEDRCVRVVSGRGQLLR